jgi:hypothetical protein
MFRLRLFEALAVGLFVGGLASRARADDSDIEGKAHSPTSPSAPEEIEPNCAGCTKRFDLSALIGVRFSSLAPFDATYAHILAAYGFGSLSPQLEVSLNGVYSLTHLLDVGVHLGYLLGSGGSGGDLFLNEIEVGGVVVARFWRGSRSWAGGVGFGVEGGLETPFLTLNGDTTSARIPYGGPLVVTRLGSSEGVLPVVHIRYIASDWASAFGKYGLPLGGLSITVGGSLPL